MIRSRALLLLVTIAWLSLTVPQISPADDLKPANLFTDNMVLQQNQPFEIWGWANPGEPITVALRDQNSTATANADGKWIASFKPIGLGEPFEIKIQGAEKTIVLKNVVAGEVWICSGQSNMEWEVKSVGNAEKEIANANWPMIRHVRIDHVTGLSKREDVTNSGWQVCSPTTVGGFSATGYYFGRTLHQKLNVPIGLLHTSWGGTIIETWISGESLKTHPDFVDPVKKIESSTSDAEEQKRLAAASRKWAAEFRAAMEDQSDQWQKPDLDDSQWKQINVPGRWEQQGYPDLDGVAWYRRQIEVPADWSGKKATLSVATVDDIDQTYVNGREVGSMNSWNAERSYPLPDDLLKPGTNTVAVRVTDGNGGGGIYGEPEKMFLEVQGKDRISLAGSWKFKPTTKTAELGPPPKQGFAGPNHPTLLHNAMVNPFLRVKARGVIWYQGESNAGRAYQYRSLMPLLIKDWRQKFKQDFSFYWVQLANFTAAAETPGPSTWAELREAQTMALSVPKTGQAVIIDIGEARDIHPKNKQDVGKRLALIALAKDYGVDTEYSGPMFKSVEFVGDQAHLTFDHANGLTAKGGPLKRFEIAGEDQKFVWADARIDGEKVVVSSDEVPNPVAVRYAWADNPEGCNLYNAAGLPASPFRTDTWKGITQHD